MIEFSAGQVVMSLGIFIFLIIITFFVGIRAGKVAKRNEIMPILILFVLSKAEKGLSHIQISIEIHQRFDGFISRYQPLYHYLCQLRSEGMISRIEDESKAIEIDGEEVPRIYYTITVLGQSRIDKLNIPIQNNES